MVVGEITAPHGVKGWVRVRPETDLDQLAGIKRCRLFWPDNKERLFEVEQVRPHRQIWLLKLKDVSSRDEAEALRGALWMIRRDEAPPLPEGHYYVPDLVGLEVVTVQGESVGEVSEVLFGPANDVFVVRRSGLPDTLIPAVREVVKEIALNQGKIIIDPLPGLLD
jgi:16S rRNA processing protein RimM